MSTSATVKSRFCFLGILVGSGLALWGGYAIDTIDILFPLNEQGYHDSPFSVIGPSLIVCLIGGLGALFCIGGWLSNGFEESV